MKWHHRHFGILWLDIEYAEEDWIHEESLQMQRKISGVNVFQQLFFPLQVLNIRQIYNLFEK